MRVRGNADAAVVLGKEQRTMGKVLSILWGYVRSGRLGAVVARELDDLNVRGCIDQAIGLLSAALDAAKEEQP
jgi:hypothetical protein